MIVGIGLSFFQVFIIIRENYYYYYQRVVSSVSNIFLGIHALKNKFLEEKKNHQPPLVSQLV